MQSWQPRDVEVLAFFIWEKNGRVEGHALEHWLEAEYLIGTSSFVPPEIEAREQEAGLGKGQQRSR